MEPSLVLIVITELDFINHQNKQPRTQTPPKNSLIVIVLIVFLLLKIPSQQWQSNYMLYFNCFNYLKYYGWGIF